MNITRYRNTLIAAAVAVSLGAGASACSKPPESTATDARSNTATDARSNTAAEPRSNPASEVLSDTAITTQVKAKLATDSSIKSSDISVTTANGVVTLDGSVSDAATRSAVERTAKSVTGVTSVYNRLSLSSGGMAAMTSDDDEGQDDTSDTWITTKVKASLLADSDAKGFDVDVETRNGVVMLQGALQDQDAVDHVTQIAAGVEGVKSVNATELTVDDQR
jgi:hyperosmotically inducible periplasmic protein